MNWDALACAARRSRRARGGAPTRSWDAARLGLPDSFVKVAVGGDGGAVWSGRIPNHQVPGDHRASAIYLPPGYRPGTRYPVVYLLSGMAGTPSSFYDGLKLADVADSLIAAREMPPFVGVMPIAGPALDPNSGEWGGGWEDYVIRDVVPWVDAHLATIPSPVGRALAGLCAGGDGAVDIGLRHPGMFGTLESWEGYFAPVFRDGPFVDATRGVLDEHDPTLLVRRQARSLLRAGVRFYVSVGGNHAEILRKGSLDFAQELASLHLQHELWLLPPPKQGHFWSATLPSALVYAGAAFPKV